MKLLLENIQRKRKRKLTMKSKKGGTEWKLKKHRPVEVRSGSVESVMLATEQQQEKYKMLLEILSRLPVKSLLRFMCVCKHWKTLISSHPFRKMHREKHNSSSPLLIASYNSYDNRREDPPYVRKLKIDTYLITSDLEGNFVERITLPLPSNIFSMRKPTYQSKLLCFVSFQLKKFYLYNPSTRQPFLLTNPCCFSSPQFQLLYNTELGYIPSKDEYVMVHLVKSNGKLYCEVLDNISISNDNFKLHYNQWRSSSTDQATTMIRGVEKSGVFVGGSFYWIALSNEIPRCDIILSFDVETECFSTIGYPQGTKHFGISKLLELKGDLYLATFELRCIILTLWKLSSSDNKLWTLYWKFDLQRLFGFTSATPEWWCFNWEMFIYNLKYLKGYDQQPCDHQVSPKMGALPQEEVEMWREVTAHTNLFTL